MSEAVPETPDLLPDLDDAIEWLATQTVPTRTTSPDLLGQLRQARQVTIRRILCIGIDPDLTCDLLCETLKTRRPEVDRGLALLAEWFGVKPVIIDNPTLENEYPNLLPELIVRRLTRKKLPFGALPTTAGILIVDSLTAATVLSSLSSRVRFSGPSSGSVETLEKRSAEADPTKRDEPASELELPVILDDHILQRRLRVTARASATVADILAMAEIAPETVHLRHGPLSAHAPIEPSTPIHQTDLWLHALPPAADPSAACTRCGECVSVCPVRLQPSVLLEAAQTGSSKTAGRFHVLACIECGLCTAVCPSSLPVKAGVIAAKRLVA